MGRSDESIVVLFFMSVVRQVISGGFTHASSIYSPSCAVLVSMSHA